MKLPLPDDIARLTNEADFEFSTYRAFERTARLRSDAAADMETQRPSHLPDSGAPRVLALQSAISDTKARIQTADWAIRRNGGSMVAHEGSYPLTVEPVKGTGGTFRALNALIRQSSAQHASISRTTLALFASSGGCGVTTIAATLGRLLSDRNEPVALVDGAPRSLLAAHFGVQNLCPGIRSIIHTTGQPSANVHVVNRPDPATTDWLTEMAQQLEGEFERMIVDVSSYFNGNDLQLLLKDATALIPLVPDLRTIFNLEPLIARLRTLGVQTGTKLPVYFILCQFDGNVRLHCEIRECLEGAYGPMLLPFTLRRSDEVSEALADGATVLDYAPNSGIAHDFRSLAEWVQHLE